MDINFIMIVSKNGLGMEEAEFRMETAKDMSILARFAGVMC